jgi:hypothetical protein
VQEEVDRFLNENLDRIRGEVRQKLLAEIALAHQKSIVEVRMILERETASLRDKARNEAIDVGEGFVQLWPTHWTQLQQGDSYSLDRGETWLGTTKQTFDRTREQCVHFRRPKITTRDPASKEEARAAIGRRLNENPGIADAIKSRLNEEIVDGFSFGKGKMTFEKADPQLVAQLTQDTSGAGSVLVPREFGDPELLARAFDQMDITRVAGQMMMLADSLWAIVVKVDVAAQSDEWRADFEKARQRYFDLFGPMKGKPQA